MHFKIWTIDGYNIKIPNPSLLFFISGGTGYMYMYLFAKSFKKRPSLWMITLASSFKLTCISLPYFIQQLHKLTSFKLRKKGFVCLVEKQVQLNIVFIFYLLSTKWKGKYCVVFLFLILSLKPSALTINNFVSFYR